jgi:transketolase
MRQEALSADFNLAKQNPKIVFIGSDLGNGTLSQMKEQLPNQFFMEGISEQHLIGFAAGLAKEGFIPFLNTIANFFTRRALEQIILDVCLHKLPVKILGSGGGMVYAPLGPTHTAIDDLAHILSIPNINVYSPSDAKEMSRIIDLEASSQLPAYIRFGKGGDEIVSTFLTPSSDFSYSFFGNISSKRVIITTGVSLQPAYHAVRTYPSEESPLLIHCAKVNIQQSSLRDLLHDKEQILIVEEHQSIGGLLTQVLHYCQKYNIQTKQIRHISLGNQFIRKYGSQSDHLSSFGITTENIRREVGNLDG